MIITNRTTHNVQQGTPAWLELRTGYPTASEAPAAQGVSRYMTRGELLRQKATGITPEHDERTLARFADGHRVEALARPMAEEFMGEDLSPVTMTAVVDGLPLLASLDGLSFDGVISWECKLWNESLAEQVRTNNLSAQYTVQMDQQQLVSGAKRTLFTCTDGTPERTAHCWYESTEEKKAAVVMHWRQFLQDVAAYSPEEAKPQVIGQAPDMLPTLRIEVQGAVVASNLDAFKTTALAAIRSVNTQLVTDQDFADADKAVKWCEEVESRLDAAKTHALGQTESIDTLFRTIDEISEEARQVRLKLSKLVKSEKEARKTQIVMDAKHDLDAHIGRLERRLEQIDGRPSRFPAVAADFAGATKGLKSLDSMRDKVAVTLASAKHDASTLADKLEANRKHLMQDGADWISLFADFWTVGTKAAEDFQALAALRIGQHKQAETQRLETEREKIRQEEAAKLQRAADAKAVADALAAQQVAAAAIKQAAAPAPAAAAAKPAAPEGETITLGQLCSLFAPVKLDAAGLAELGFTPVATIKAAKHYAAGDVPRIVARLIERLQGIAVAA